QLVVLETMWKYSFPMIIGARGMSKSFSFAVYCLLRALVTQGCKIIIISASFRQAKNTFEYIEQILNNAPILRDLIGGSFHCTHGNDMWVMTIGDSSIKAVPLGSGGETIRGLRANYILVDEFASIPEEVYEVVVRGFGAVSSTPSENVIKEAQIAQLKEWGDWTEEHQKKLLSSERPNQIILTGTGDWGF